MPSSFILGISIKLQQSSRDQLQRTSDSHIRNQKQKQKRRIKDIGHNLGMQKVTNKIIDPKHNFFQNL